MFLWYNMRVSRVKKKRKSEAGKERREPQPHEYPLGCPATWNFFQVGHEKSSHFNLSPSLLLVFFFLDF